TRPCNSGQARPEPASRPAVLDILSPKTGLLKVESRWHAELQGFAQESASLKRGASVTDLDGPAVLESEGRVAIPHVVSHALKTLNEQGIPVAINTLRFPANVIATFGREWSAITDAPLPLISLNGSLIGSLLEHPDGSVTFEEIQAFPLSRPEIEEVLEAAETLMSSDLSNLVLFYYPRDWQRGEIIWTPLPGRIERLLEKYKSATRIHASPLSEVRREVLGEDICMMLLMIEEPSDRLMAYQHALPGRFVTARGVDKKSGWLWLAERLGVEPRNAVGAGDTSM